MYLKLTITRFFKYKFLKVDVINNTTFKGIPILRLYSISNEKECNERRTNVFWEQLN